MTDDIYNGHKYARGTPSELLIDRGARKEEPKPCLARTSCGGLCVMSDGHQGEHIPAGPPVFDHPQRAVDHKVMAKPAKPRAAAGPAQEVAVVWPAIGSRFRDSAGRTLTITAIAPTSPIDRHVVGKLSDGADYACSREVFDATWTPIDQRSVYP